MAMLLITLAILITTRRLSDSLIVLAICDFIAAVIFLRLGYRGVKGGQGGSKAH